MDNMYYETTGMPKPVKVPVEDLVEEAARNAIQPIMTAWEVVGGPIPRRNRIIKSYIKTLVRQLKLMKVISDGQNL